MLLEQCVEYLDSVAKPEDKWKILLQTYFAGYITADVLNEVYGRLLNDPEAKDHLPEISNLGLDDCSTLDANSGTIVPKYILDLETAQKYKPEPCESIWGYKETPDNTLGYKTTNDPNIFAIYWFEELGFIQIGQNMVSRTVQSVYIEKERRILKDAILMLPYMDLDILAKNIPHRAGMTGGAQFYCLCRLAYPSELIATSLNSKATCVLVCVGVPKELDKPYPYSLISHNPQFADSVIYE